MPDPAKTPENEPEKESASFDGSRSEADTKRMNRRLSGIVYLCLGLLMAYLFISVADEAGSDPSGALIFFLTAPIAVFGGICILIGIVKLLLSAGPGDHRPVEQNAVPLDSSIATKEEKDDEPDQKIPDYTAGHLVKKTASFAAGYVLMWVVVVPLLVIFTFAVFGGQLADFFFR